MTLHRILLAAGLCGLAALSSPAQTPPKPADKDKSRSNLHTELKDDADKNRDQLVQNIKKLMLQIQAADDVLAELRKADDGTRESHARMIVIGLIKERDRVVLMNPVAASMEHLRFAMEKERVGYEALKARREADGKISQQRADALADRLLDLDEALVRITDPDERKLAERRRADVQSQLASQLQLRDERLAGVREYDRAVATLGREKKELKALEDWLDHESRMAAVRVERLNDAVQHGAQEDLRQESDESKKALQTVVDAIRGIRDTAPLPSKSAPNSAPAGAILPDRKADPPTVPQARIDEAMKQAAERRKAKKP